MITPLTQEELDNLRRINSPTIANALERLGIKESHKLAMDSSIKCIFPEFDVMVGYACTLLVRSAEPPANHGRETLMKRYWDHMSRYPAPRIAVAQELDQPPAGAFWGEVNSNIHRTLGCVALITNGTVRDLDEVRPLGFQFFASALSVSHAYAHLEDFDKPVTVGGLLVRPGDLLHADKHGVISIPHELARDVVEAARAVERFERPMIDLCKSSNFSTARLDELMRSDII